MLDAKSLIGEVAKRHGVLLDQHDPVLVTVTLNEVILREYVEQVKVAVEDAQTRTLVASSQQVADAKKAASELITRTGGYVADQVRTAGAAVRADLEGILRSELEHLRTERAAAARDRRLALVFAIVSAVASSVAVFAALQVSTR